MFKCRDKYESIRMLNTATRYHGEENVPGWELCFLELLEDQYERGLTVNTERQTRQVERLWEKYRRLFIIEDGEVYANF